MEISFFLAQIVTKWLMENFTNPASWLIKLLIPCHWPAWVKQFQWSQFLLGIFMGLLWKTQWKLNELTHTIETYSSTMCGFNISSYNGVAFCMCTLLICTSQLWWCKRLRGNVIAQFEVLLSWHCVRADRSNCVGANRSNPESTTRWRHQMETFSALLAFCVGNSPVTGELWCFLFSAPEPTVEQTMETLLIWDATTLIMMSL